MKALYIKIAGIINLITAIIHVIGGQVDLVNPLLDSNMTGQAKGELVSVWHMVTILLFLTSYIIIKVGFGKGKPLDLNLLKAIGVLYVLMGLPFIISSLWYGIFAPQWILLMPIGILILIGIKKMLKGQFPDYFKSN